MAAKKQFESIGSLWKKHTAGGDEYLQGVIRLPDGTSTELRLMIFKNQFKTIDSNVPDMVIYMRTPDHAELALILETTSEGS